ncbi:MAG: ABC transporter permease subunit [Planctomycetota bacterium]
MSSPLTRTLRDVLPVLVLAIFVLFGWTFAASWWELPKSLLPTPLECARAAWMYRQDLIGGFVGTGIAAVAGLSVAFVAGLLMSIVFEWFPWLRKAAFPYVMLLQTVPIVAIAPLLIIWSGYTFRTVALVTTVVCLFPIINAASAGLRRVEPEMSDLFDLYHVNKWRRLIRLQMPASIRDLVVGLKTAAGLSVIGAIVAEFFVGNGTRYDGLGTLMSGWQAMAQTDALIAAIVASTLLGLLLFGLINLLTRTLLSRWVK